MKRNAREAIFPSHVQSTEAPCKTRSILTNRLRADLKVYADAIRALPQSVGKDDFEKAHQRAERARRAYEMAREKLNRHVESHGCG